MPSISRAQDRIIGSVRIPLAPELEQSLMNLFSAALLPSNLHYEDELVIPTSNQISQGSRITRPEHLDPTINCSICQDRGGSSMIWRTLYCNHSFHNACILSWFDRSVNCPVCRADIRDARAEAAASGIAAAEAASGIAAAEAASGTAAATTATTAAENQRNAANNLDID